MNLNELMSLGTLTVQGVGTILAYGDHWPANGSKGYARGCLFLHVHAEAGALYVNVGDAESSLFISVV